MEYANLYSETIKCVPRSFIREILKTAISPDVISFAGGLPNPELFPIEAFKLAAEQAIMVNGTSAFQYSNSEGLLSLRVWICEQYLIQDGLVIHPDQILITNGSQQGLDLLAKVLINPGDEVFIEEPGYLGAIQSLSVQGSRFVNVPINSEGVEVEIFREKLMHHQPKLFYSVPAFQNPTGISYSAKTIASVAELVRDRPMLIVEDTPYRELAFKGERPVSFYPHLPEQTVLLGSFSKTTVPGFRIGWMVAPLGLMDRLVVAKQASDLHTDIFGQCVLMQYLLDNDHQAHIQLIQNKYSHQCRFMEAMMKEYFPKEVKFISPGGGMFIWAELSQGVSSLKLFDAAIKEKVAFVPGVPFYSDGRSDCNTMRLNFTCSGDDDIKKGIKLLGSVIDRMYSMN